MRLPPRSLRVLIVDDSEHDTFLLLRELTRGGFDSTWKRIETADALREALETQAWELIVSNDSMPSFSALQAVEVLRQSGRDVPFIVISGTVSEQIAIDALKSGASDFMAKSNFARLVPAIERELREASSRRERTGAMDALRESEERYRVLFEHNPFPTFIFEVATLRFLEANEAALQRYGYSRDVFLAMSLPDLWPSPDTAVAVSEGARTGPDVQRYAAVQKRATAPASRSR